MDLNQNLTAFAKIRRAQFLAALNAKEHLTLDATNAPQEKSLTRVNALTSALSIITETVPLAKGNKIFQPHLISLIIACAKQATIRMIQPGFNHAIPAILNALPALKLQQIV